MAGFDPWATSNGLWQEADVEIRDAVFEFNPNYKDGEALVLTLDVQSADPEVGENGTDTILVPVGTGWDKGDKEGTFAKHESGKDRNFNVNAGMGILVNSVRDVPELIEALDGLDPRQASTWVGLKVTLTRVHKEFKVDGEVIAYSRFIITGYQGQADKAEAAKPAAKKAAAKAEAPMDDSSGKAIAADNSDVPKVVLVKLTKLAKECSDHDEFVERALTEVDGADADGVSDKVLDPDFFAGLL